MGYIGKEGSSDGKEDSKDSGKDGSSDSFMPQIMNLNQDEASTQAELVKDHYLKGPDLERPAFKPGNIFSF